MISSPRWVVLLCLVFASCDDSDSSSAGSPAVADCSPQIVTWELAADGSSTPVPPDGDEALVAAVAKTFCSTEWTAVYPDGTESSMPARAVLPGEDSACIADRLVASLGAARVQEFGLGVGPWSVLGFGLGNNFGGRQTSRAEAELVVEAFTACSDRWKLLLIRSVTEGADQIGDQSAACVDEKLDEDDAKEMLIGELDRGVRRSVAAGRGVVPGPDRTPHRGDARVPHPGRARQLDFD